MPAMIRIALPGDLNAIRQLEIQIAKQHNALRPDLYRANPGLMAEDYFLNLLNDPNQYAFVAQNDGGDVVGVLLCEIKAYQNSSSIRDMSLMHVLLLCVRHDCRRQGIGKMLMEQCRQAAMERGCYSVELNLWRGNASAEAFYLAQGFHDKTRRMELVLPGNQVDVTHAWIQTPRLTLRPWRESDLDDFYAYASTPGLGEMAGWPHHESIETSKMILQDFISGKQVFALEHLESGKVIGSLGLHSSWADEDPAFQGLRCIEVGYAMSRDYWGQGLMPEAVKAVIAYCFGALRADLLTIGHFDFNDQSRRVIEKTGFRYYRDGVFHAELLGKDIPEKKYILPRPGLELF